MKSISPMTSSDKRDVAMRTAVALLALFIVVLLAAGCAEKKPDSPLTESEKAAFKERSARH